VRANEDGPLEEQALRAVAEPVAVDEAVGREKSSVKGQV